MAGNPMKDRSRIRFEVIGMNEGAISSAMNNAFDDSLDEMEREIDRIWRSKVESTLHTTKQGYLDGLSVTRVGNEVRAVLKGYLPNAVEYGTETSNMKDRLLAGNLSRIIPINAGGVTKFRTVSAGSSGWDHKIKARNFHEEVLNEIEDLSATILTDFISRISV